MPIRIHIGPHLLWLADRPDETPDSRLSTPGSRLVVHPHPADLDTILQSLDDAAPQLVMLTGTAPEELLRSLQARFTCIDAAGGVVVDPQGRFLLIHRRGHWDLPKGKLDEGEQLEACALREVTEETGLHSIRSQGYLTTTYHVYGQDGQPCLKASHWYRMAFFGTEKAVPQTEEDIERIEWLTREEVAERLPGAYASIREVMAACGVSPAGAWG
jgi:8-oxo-dGTP pyrophosphatase MutT (NUDIX family)